MSNILSSRAAVVVLGLIVAILIVVLGIVLINRDQARPNNTRDEIGASNESGIHGILDVNGVIPDGATASISQKEVGSQKEASVFISGLAVLDGDSWSFSKAENGKTYEIQASVIVNGETVITSSPIVVTAPADQEALVLNIESDTASGNAVISGNIIVNGYIPDGATITVQGRKLGSEDFTAVASNLPGQSRQFMSYTTAIAGTTYEIQGFLLNAQGVTIGTSTTLALTAPAVNESLVINSQATAPSPTIIPTTATSQLTSTPAPNTGGGTVISGSINFNGAVPSNSRIVVFQKPLNGGSYQVAVDNITPVDGTSWTWNGPQNATWYTMIAILKQRNSNGTDTDIADSQPITIAAPASNVILTINSGVSLSAPGGSITVNCQTYNSGPNQNFWNVQINFGTMASAQSYYFQVGTTNGGNNTVNTTQNTQTGSNQTMNANFNNNTTYYARYAYSNVANQSTTSNQYSGFSNTTPLQCGN